MHHSGINPSIRPWALLFVCIGLMWCVGIVGRGYWKPDEPREADITWRMSTQADRAVPLLAGEPFCEKPPLTYWIAAIPVRLFGPGAWAARLPNLAYGLIIALSVYALGHAAGGRLFGAIAAAAVSTLLLSYQVIIWLATDAPLLASVSVALLGLYRGFYALDSRARLRGYLLMHAALTAAFLSKSAAAWMVPALAFATLVVWERRWRELLRWELYPGLLIECVAIGTWVLFVYLGPHGTEHLRVFFWNNLVGRFTKVAAQGDIQYTSGHKNQFGKYVLELPVYLFPWTLLVIAAVRQAWRKRHAGLDELRPLRFALAVTVPALVLLSFAATARNVYFAPALPGVALLLGWWVRGTGGTFDRWDGRALRATAAVLIVALVLTAAAVTLVGWDAWDSLPSAALYVIVSGAGIILSGVFAVNAWREAGHGSMAGGMYALLMAYCILLIGPTSQVLRRVDRWQDLERIGMQIKADTPGRNLILFAPDETTRAFIDMYTNPSVTLIPEPADAVALDYLRQELADHPSSAVVAMLPTPGTGEQLRAVRERLGLAVHTSPPATPALPRWVEQANLNEIRRYELPHGRRYALLELRQQLAAR